MNRPKTKMVCTALEPGVAGNLEGVSAPVKLAQAAGLYFALTPYAIGLVKACCGSPDPLLEYGQIKCWNCLAYPEFDYENCARWDSLEPAILEAWLRQKGLDPLAVTLTTTELFADFEQWTRRFAVVDKPLDFWASS